MLLRNKDDSWLKIKIILKDKPCQHQSEKGRVAVLIYEVDSRAKILPTVEVI